MKKFFITVWMLVAGMAAVAQEQLIVDANASVRQLQGSFNKIKISHAIKVIITQSDNESIAVSAADEKFKEEIKTEVSGNTLKISRAGGIDWRGKDKKLRVYVSFSNLDVLDITGACDVAIVGKINQNSLTVNITGASSLKGAFSLKNMEVEMNGASRATLSGNVETLNLECNGATTLNAFDLKVIKGNISVTGASDVDISVEKELNGTASGASQIKYKGNPSPTNAKTSGASTISKKD